MGGNSNATKIIGATYVSTCGGGGGGDVGDEEEEETAAEGSRRRGTCKAVVNQWFSTVAAVHVCRNDDNDNDDDIPCSSSSSWALVLDTEILATVKALDRAGAVPVSRCVVPNPDPAVAEACKAAGAHGVVATSHQLLVPDGPVHPLIAAQRQQQRLLDELVGAAAQGLLALAAAPAWAAARAARLEAGQRPRCVASSCRPLQPQLWRLRHHQRQHHLLLRLQQQLQHQQQRWG